MKNFVNRVAVITGAASGFGREFAAAGAQRGMKLVLGDVRQEALDQAICELRAQGAQVVGMQCDVSKGEEVEALARLALDNYGGAHVVFNNAGVGSGGLVWENSVKDWEWVLGVNLWGVIHGVRVFTPLMLAQSAQEDDYEGHIVNTASIAGLLTAPLMGVYNTSKHAVVALTETLYHDLKAVNARINCSVLCPAFVATGISESHRTRPAALHNDTSPTPSMRAAQAMVEKATSAGKVTPAQIAALTFAAIRDEQFYVLTHPKIMATVNLRLEDIGKLQNPRDPFALKEELKPKLD